MKKEIGFTIVAFLAVQMPCEANDAEDLELEQSIRGLVDPGNLDIRLSPDGVDEIQSVKETDIGAEDVVDALSVVAPGETLVASSEGEKSWEGSTQTFLVKLEYDSRSIHIEDAVERLIPATVTDSVDDAAVSEMLRMFLVALGAREAELGEPEVHALLRQAVDVTDGTEGPIMMVGKAAFFSRQFGGIPVFGNRVHLTVTPQGELFTISGRWAPIDYAHSVLTSAVTEEEVVDRAVAALAEAGTRVDHAPEIVIETAYRIVDDACYGEIVVLKGFATAIYHQESEVDDADGWPESSETVEFDLQ